MPGEFLNPQLILKELKLKKDMVAADFGCGSGGWAIPLAKILEDGLVYAIDILKEPLSALEGNAKLEKISNIKTILANVENKNGSGLPDSSVDWILMVNLLFQLDDKRGVFVEARRILKKNGRILVVDWTETTPISLGPSPKERILPEEVKKIASEFEFKLKEEFKAGLYHYALVFEKP